MSVGGVNCGVGDTAACNDGARGVDLSELAFRINDGRLDWTGRRSGVTVALDVSGWWFGDAVFGENHVVVVEPERAWTEVIDPAEPVLCEASSPFPNLASSASSRLF